MYIIFQRKLDFLTIILQISKILIIDRFHIDVILVHFTAVDIDATIARAYALPNVGTQRVVYILNRDSLILYYNRSRLFFW